MVGAAKLEEGRSGGLREHLTLDGNPAAVIVPAYNAERHIGRCLEALKRNGLPIGIIVVDDASGDATAAIAEAMGARVMRLKMRSGPGGARNAGVEFCTADIVIFVDADVEVAPGSLSNMLAFLKNHPEFAAVFGSYDDSPGGASIVSQYRDLIFHYRHQTGRTEADTFWSGFSAVRREPFLSVGGFASDHQHDGVEDIELGTRLRAANYRIALRRNLLCKHHKHWTLRSMIYIDLFKRALPWSRLLLERRYWAGDLNLRRDRRLGVALAGAGTLCVAASLIEPLFLVFASAAWAGALLIERNFFRFLWSKAVRLTVAGVALHLVHLSAAAAGFVLAALEYAARRCLEPYVPSRVVNRTRSAGDA